MSTIATYATPADSATAEVVREALTAYRAWKTSEQALEEALLAVTPKAWAATTIDAESREALSAALIAAAKQSRVVPGKFTDEELAL